MFYQSILNIVKKRFIRLRYLVLTIKKSIKSIELINGQEELNKNRLLRSKKLIKLLKYLIKWQYNLICNYQKYFEYKFLILYKLYFEFIELKKNYPLSTCHYN